ncbi:MAG: glycosyltransferase [Mycoplasmoidaceae bacterium]|nr:glycosyltransferase [Mycoplasmoidaceae bacterium]
MQPKISILISTYNGEKKVRRAVSSALKQTYKNIEIICLDDCSTDTTHKILLELQKADKRIKVFKNKKNLGIAKNRNLLINYASGEYFTFLDDDDTLTKHICKDFINKLGTKQIDIAPFKARIIFYSFFVIPWFCTSKINNKTNQFDYVNSSLCPP